MTTNVSIPGQAHRDPWRICAAIGTGTLIPTTVFAWVLVLSTYEASRCLTYGECNRNVDALLSVAWWAFLGSVAAGLLALVLPKRWQAMKRLRPVLAITQLLLQAITFAAILGSA
ncbi:hypothetical protein [Streptosporangium lutulentum]|uniref:Uncharacterized protein n=1 Tax=Streptosporangium lutulentum TaxID=1461250 RepID=A0ABT9QCX5_9ACTN|nr:hypothetical protein [Streptosporangium lutulentum]MDP9844576.1 hypothetical protein [Streptosporangium lutulentum]